MKHSLAFVGMALVALAACTPAPSTPNDSASSSSSLAAMMNASSASSTNQTAWDGTIMSGKHTVIMKTSKGDITLELDADAAPKTATNFIALAKSGYYNGLTFHRVIPGFMIQGGDPSGNGTGGNSIYGETFEDEIDENSSLYEIGYQAGVIAMANRGPNTNGSQFFIMDADYPLPPNYTIFGRVTKGQDVVHAIATVDRDPSNDMPTTPVTFTVQVVK
jgi:cyclophilin family peptidyl-prolyl cis-trans isomerase